MSLFSLYNLFVRRILTSCQIPLSLVRTLLAHEEMGAFFDLVQKRQLRGNFIAGCTMVGSEQAALVYTIPVINTFIYVGHV